MVAMARPIPRDPPVTSATRRVTFSFAMADILPLLLLLRAEIRVLGKLHEDQAILSFAPRGGFGQFVAAIEPAGRRILLGGDDGVAGVVRRQCLGRRDHWHRSAEME